MKNLNHIYNLFRKFKSSSSEYKESICTPNKQCVQSYINHMQKGQEEDMNKNFCEALYKFKNEFNISMQNGHACYGVAIFLYSNYDSNIGVFFLTIFLITIVTFLFYLSCIRLIKITVILMHII